MGTDVQMERTTAAKEEPQAIEAEPGRSSGDPPLEERTYSKAEVEEILREHLLRFQALPIQETQQSSELARRELDLEKKSYLGRKIHIFAAQVPPFRGRALDLGTAYEDFCNRAEGLYGFLEAEEYEGFTKSVDTVFDLLDFISKVYHNAGYLQCKSDYEGQAQAQDPQAKADIVSEIFKAGGHF